MAVSYSIFKTISTDAVGEQTEGVAVSSTDTYYSKPWGAAGTDGQAVQLEWSGDPVGVFTLWWSCKDHPILTTDADWIEDTDFTPTNPAGSASKMGDNAGNMKANLKRVKYVNASGTGVLKGWVTVA